MNILKNFFIFASFVFSSFALYFTTSNISTKPEERPTIGETLYGENAVKCEYLGNSYFIVTSSEGKRWIIKNNKIEEINPEKNK